MLKIAKASFLLIALCSLVYAVVTAPHQGIDLKVFQEGAQNWLAGTFTFESGPSHLYPPFTLPLFVPLALVSFDHLLIIFLLVNLAATAVVIFLIVKLFGQDWPPGAWLYLSAFLIAWAPFRVTLRVGQVSLIVTALLLAALLARQKKKPWVSGLLLGLSLFKYSMTLPFLLYFIWKREWKIVVSSLGLIAVLTEISALGLGISPIEATRRSLQAVGEVQTTVPSGYVGTTGIRSFIFSLTGGNLTLTVALTTLVLLATLVWLAISVWRRPEYENIHFAALALFALWMAYHRTYDSVLCILPAAVLVDLYVKAQFKSFARFWLAALGLFVISVPGVLTERLKLSDQVMATNPAAWLGLHTERFLVMGLFWSLTYLLWKLRPNTTKADSQAA